MFWVEWVCVGVAGFVATKLIVGVTVFLLIRRVAQGAASFSREIIE